MIPYFLPNKPNFRTLILDLIFFGSAYRPISKIIINNKQKTIIFRAKNWPRLIWQFGLLTRKYSIYKITYDEFPHFKTGVLIFLLATVYIY